MSRSKNWVEKLRNNFQEEEIIFKTCNNWCSSYLNVEENRFRNWLLTDQSDDTTRIYPNDRLRNFYIHDSDAHKKSNEECEKAYIKLLHLMIFEMERLNTLVS